jgi:hypothetical protein
MLVHRCVIWLAALPMLITVQAQQSCKQLKRLSFDVSTAQDVAELAAAAACNGKALSATWNGALVLSDTITVGSNTSLTIKAATGKEFSAAATIDGNSTTQLFVVNGNLSITGMSLQNGFAITQGGAINALASAFVVLKNCTLTRHRAPLGAAIFINSRGMLQIDDAYFSFNMAESIGSSVHAIKATVNISSSVFVDEVNSAVFAKDASTVTVINSTFSNSSGLLGAGVACLNSTALYVSGCLFDSNQASQTSGAIAIVSQSQMLATNTTFRSNTAVLSGGAIGAFDNSSAELTDVSTVIYIYHTNILYVKYTSTVKHYYSLYSDDLNATSWSTAHNITILSMFAMLQCRFLNNTATVAGGGAVTTFQSTLLSINGCTFEGNKAGTLRVHLQLHYIIFKTTCAVLHQFHRRVANSSMRRCNTRICDHNSFLLAGDSCVLCEM